MSGVNAPGRRRLDSSVPPEYDVPTREPRLASRRLADSVVLLTALAWLVGVIGCTTSIVEVHAPTSVERPSAALLLVVFAVSLTHRAGGHLRIWLTIVALLAVLAVATQMSAVIAAAAVVTGVLSSVCAITITRPAETVVQALGEYVLAVVVALSGTLAVASWNAPVEYQRFNLMVLGAALALAIATVWNLGAGLHGMGRQGLLILVGVAAVIILVLVYSSFVRSHGSRALTDAFSNSVIWMRQNVHGAPRPVEVFIGFPALIVGVSVRAKHREGWWVLVFAVLGTGVLATSLVTPGAYPSYIALSTLYSVVLGGVVGLVARHFALRDSSSRASRAIERVKRVEPPRVAPLK